MAKYTYKAVDTSGKLISGQIEAANEADLESRISNMDLDLIRYKSEKKPLLSWRLNKVDNKELITFNYQLEQLLSAGVPLVDALQDLRESTTHAAFKDIIAGLIENIGTGKTFSQSLALYPKIFSPVYISMVQVGEGSGQLVKVLKDSTEMLRWQFELRTKAKRMAVYPSFVIVVVTLMILFLMTYLVPKLIPFIKLAGQEIAWHTQLLQNTSDFFIHYWYILLILPFGIVTLFFLATKYSKGLRYKWDGLKLKLWLIGPISYKIKMARFCNYFALMYASGITVLNAIVMGKQVINNLVLENALERAHDQISEGESISLSFANTGLFPALVVRMLRVGENTGAMSEALLNVSYFYDKEVNEAIDSIEPAIMPTITIFLGLIFAWIAISVFNPIYEAVVNLPVL